MGRQEPLRLQLDEPHTRESRQLRPPLPVAGRGQPAGVEVGAPGRAVPRAGGLRRLVRDGHGRRPRRLCGASPSRRHPARPRRVLDEGHAGRVRARARRGNEPRLHGREHRLLAGALRGSGPDRGRVQGGARSRAEPRARDDALPLARSAPTRVRPARRPALHGLVRLAARRLSGRPRGRSLARRDRADFVQHDRRRRQPGARPDSGRKPCGHLRAG